MRLASSLIDVDINEALHSFNDCLKQNAEYTKRKTYVNRPKRMDEWYDEECRTARKNVRKLLRKFRKSLDRAEIVDYCFDRREYKKLMQQKKEIQWKCVEQSYVVSIRPTGFLTEYA